jgi:diguanylate cyclase (GGDEF)-like protein
VDKDDHEIDRLRRQLAALTEQARHNDTAWRRAQRRERALLEADTLAELLERLTTGLRASYRLTAVTLAVQDQDHEIRRLLALQGPAPASLADVLFVDTVRSFAPPGGPGPWLGAYVARDHAPLFPRAAALESVALLPLARRGAPIASLNFGSAERSRFAATLGTELLAHLAATAAFCLDGAVNRARLVRSGFTDVLTGWHNRRYLEERLQEELSRCRRETAPLTCLMIDVDHFKSVNDRFGHLAGDDVLRQVAARITREVRVSDVSARYGGEEFVILLPATPRTAGHLLAERVRAAVASAPFDVQGLAAPLGVTVSIGVAEYRAADGDGSSAGGRLLARADAALYEAKAGGRNAVREAANS